MLPPSLEIWDYVHNFHKNCSWKHGFNACQLMDYKSQINTMLSVMVGNFVSIFQKEELHFYPF